MIYSSTDRENILVDELTKLKGKTVSYDELNESVSSIMKCPMKSHPYDTERKVLSIYWSNSSYYHGAYLKCVPVSDDAYEIHDIDWYTELDAHPVYF